jgi:hypothetical protein
MATQSPHNGSTHLAACLATCQSGPESLDGHCLGTHPGCWVLGAGCWVLGTQTRQTTIPPTVFCKPEPSVLKVKISYLQHTRPFLFSKYLTYLAFIHSRPAACPFVSLQCAYCCSSCSRTPLSTTARQSSIQASRLYSSFPSVLMIHPTAHVALAMFLIPAFGQGSVFHSLETSFNLKPSPLCW